MRRVVWAFLPLWYIRFRCRSPWRRWSSAKPATVPRWQVARKSSSCHPERGSRVRSRPVLNLATEDGDGLSTDVRSHLPAAETHGIGVGESNTSIILMTRIWMLRNFTWSISYATLKKQTITLDYRIRSRSLKETDPGPITLSHPSKTGSVEPKDMSEDS